jgi:hexulose-6-phosphate isomerase
MEGDSDWPAVMAALDSVGYTGWMITEQWRGPDLTDQAYLEQLSAKLDTILAV